MSSYQVSLERHLGRGYFLCDKVHQGTLEAYRQHCLCIWGTDLVALPDMEVLQHGGHAATPKCFPHSPGSRLGTCSSKLVSNGIDLFLRDD